MVRPSPQLIVIMDNITLNLTLSIEELASLRVALKRRIKEVTSKLERIRKLEVTFIGQNASKEEIRELAEVADYWVEKLKQLDSILEKVTNY